MDTIQALMPSFHLDTCIHSRVVSLLASDVSVGPLALTAFLGAAAVVFVVELLRIPLVEGIVICDSTFGDKYFVAEKSNHANHQKSEMPAALMIHFSLQLCVRYLSGQ
jgi:hypothetical protein